MTTTEDKPVDREAWRRLLDGEDDGPPELTDARIRAKARQAIVPRTGRWWLPASLVASLLLAVLLVQRQYEKPSAPSVVSESDYAAAPADDPDPQRQDELLREAAPPEASVQVSPPLESRMANAPTAANKNKQERVAAAEGDSDASRMGGFVESPPPVVPPPLVELPQMSDARATSAAPAEAPAAAAAPAAEAKREEEDLREIMVTGSRRRDADQESSTPVTQATAAELPAQGVAHSGGLLKSGVAERTPEEWYAEIEKLRAAGKKREAKRELEKLRKAHPGWLEENYPKER